MYAWCIPTNRQQGLSPECLCKKAINLNGEAYLWTALCAAHKSGSELKWQRWAISLYSPCALGKMENITTIFDTQSKAMLCREAVSYLFFSFYLTLSLTLFNNPFFSFLVDLCLMFIKCYVITALLKKKQTKERKEKKTPA